MGKSTFLVMRVRAKHLPGRLLERMNFLLLKDCFSSLCSL
jgi:hypothetical protein